MIHVYVGLPAAFLGMAAAASLTYVWDWAKREFQWRKCIKAAKQGK